MPYIKLRRRDEISVDGEPPDNPGELTYALTEIARSYLPLHPSYQDFNEVIGALECTKLELYRRMIAPYEDEKRDENGDVY